MSESGKQLLTEPVLHDVDNKVPEVITINVSERIVLKKKSSPATKLGKSIPTKKRTLIN